MKYIIMNNTIAIIKVKGDMTLPIYLELTDDFKEAIANGCHRSNNGFFRY